MGRTLMMLMVVLLVVLGHAKPAEAVFWAWLEKWSGPGPFRGKTFLFTMCVQDTPVKQGNLRLDQIDNVDRILQTNSQFSIKPSPLARSDTFHQTRERVWRVTDPANRGIFQALLANPEVATLVATAPDLVAGAINLPMTADAGQRTQADARATGRFADFVRQVYEQPHAVVGPGHNHERLICGYADHGRFEAPADDTRGYGELRARMYDFGPSARIHDGIDIGGGVGFVRFRGEGVDVKKGVFTPLRIVLRPLVLAVPDRWRQNWLGVVSIYWKESYVWGRLTASDFNVRGASDWSEDGEFIRSFGLTFDLSALIPTRLNIRKPAGRQDSAVP